MLRTADVVAITLQALCEFVWVLTRWYKLRPDQIARSIRTLIDSANVRADVPAVHAGLALCEAGGDFADGVIAFEGSRLGAMSFASFDRSATQLVDAHGGAALLLTVK